MGHTQQILCFLSIGREMCCQDMPWHHDGDTICHHLLQLTIEVKIANYNVYKSFWDILHVCVCEREKVTFQMVE